MAPACPTIHVHVIMFYMWLLTSSSDQGPIWRTLLLLHIGIIYIWFPSCNLEQKREEGKKVGTVLLFLDHECIKVLSWNSVKPGLPQWLSSKESACNAADTGSVPELGRSPGGGNGNPLQYSCLENPTGKRAWGAFVPGVTKNKTQPSNWACVWNIRGFPKSRGTFLTSIRIAYSWIDSEKGMPLLSYWWSVLSCIF